MIRSILVPLVGLASDHAALESAYLVARTFTAHLDCVHTRPDVSSMAIPVGLLGPRTLPVITAKVWKALEEHFDQCEEDAKATFQRFCTERGIELGASPSEPSRISAMFEQREGNPVRQAISLSRTHDLVVTGRSYGAPESDTAGIADVLLESGRPLLLAPREAPAEIGSTTVVAWKDCAEAARAIGAAIPFLAKARTVVILAASESSLVSDGTMASVEHVTEYLLWHGIHAQTRCVNTGWGSAHDAILQGVADAEANLLVMGAYGHSRRRELIFGGFTRAVLNDAPVPVLMMH